jgi:hypothetical protein
MTVKKNCNSCFYNSNCDQKKYFEGKRNSCASFEPSEKYTKENRIIKIGNFEIADFGKIRLTSSAGFTESAIVRYLDPYHFEMSNTKGEFDACGSHVWANTEYEIFCCTNKISLEAI